MTQPAKTSWLFFWGLLALSASTGCRSAAPLFYVPPDPPQMLGMVVDELNEHQEVNAEASKYVFYQHEFELNEFGDGRTAPGLRLNPYGEDHAKRVAANLRAHGATFPVVVERSQTSSKDDTEFHYPVHFNADLDLQRRAVVVAALEEMGIGDAENLVVVAPAFAQPYTAIEAQRAYLRGIRGNRSGGYGGGGGFGGGGFGGGFGSGFGGGFF